MKYREMGRTGFEVSEIGHGLWGMSGWSGSEDDSRANPCKFPRAAAAIFTIPPGLMAKGRATRCLVSCSRGITASVKKQRQIFLRTCMRRKIPPMNKKWPASPTDRYDEVFPSKHVFKYMELIREKLGVDSIDLLQFHVWNDNWASDRDFRRTVAKLKTEGQIRAFGLSLNWWEPANESKH